MKKIGIRNPKPIPSSLVRNSSFGSRPETSDQPHQKARRERAENRREAELVCQHPAAQRKCEGGAHAELTAPLRRRLTCPVRCDR